MSDPWTVMGLQRGASQEEIKERWRQLCKQHHPDLQPAELRPKAEKHFKEISGAFRTLTARGSSLAAYADYTAAQAAAAAAGHPFATGYRTAWQAGGGGGGPQAKFSNGVVAAVLFIPLVITGIWMARSCSGDEHNYWRPHGLLSPPENPFLREDQKPRVYSHLLHWQEKRRAEAAAAEAAAAQGSPLAAAAQGLSPAAAAASRGGSG